MFKKIQYLMLVCSLVFGLAMFVSAASMPGVNETWAPTGQYIGPFGNHLRSTPGGFAAPTISSCGTSTVSGTDSVMSVVITAGSPSTCAVTFGATWAAAPLCWYNDITTANANGGKAVSTTALITVTPPTFTGAASDFASDTLNIFCMGKS